MPFSISSALSASLRSAFLASAAIDSAALATARAPVSMTPTSKRSANWDTLDCGFGSLVVRSCLPLRELRCAPAHPSTLAHPSLLRCHPQRDVERQGGAGPCARRARNSRGPRPPGRTCDEVFDL